VTVGVAGLGAAVVPGTMHVVRFGGGRSIEIPAGAQALSDPVAMRVQPLQELAVSVYVPDSTGPATNHSDAQQVNWVSTAGDHAAQAGGAAFTTQSQSWYFLDDVIVRSARAVRRRCIRRLHHRRLSLQRWRQCPLAKRSCPAPRCGAWPDPGRR
jgi:hypothetical protein